MERNWGDWVSEHGLSGKLILNQIVMATEEMFILHSLCGDFSLQNFILWLRTWWPLIYRGPLRYLLWSLWERVLFASNSHPWTEQFTPCKFPGNNNQGLSLKWHSAVTVTCEGTEEIAAALDSQEHCCQIDCELRDLADTHSPHEVCIFYVPLLCSEN